MGLREWMEGHTGVVTGAVVLLLVGSAALLVWQFLGESGLDIPDKAWFYDLETQQPFPASKTLLAPIDAPSGKKDAAGEPVGVRAYVYSCGRCDSEQDRFTAYLERWTAEGRLASENMEKLDNGQPVTGPALTIGDYQRLAEEGRSVAKPDKPYQWLSSSTPEARTLVQTVSQRCPGGTLTECFPK